MDDYNRGKRDIMLEMANDDLVDVASRIAVLEEDLDAARKLKWDLVRKISLLENMQLLSASRVVRSCPFTTR